MTSAILEPIVVDDAVLRMLAEDDLALTLAWRNHPDSREGFHTSAVIAPEDHLAWYRRYRERDDDYVFVLDLAGTAVAQAALYDIADGSAEFGRLLVDPDRRGAGLSHRVIALCLTAAEQLGIDRLHLEVKRDNARAIGAYRRAGFLPDPATAGQHDSLVMRRTRS